jgi:hypothetical protein
VLLEGIDILMTYLQVKHPFFDCFTLLRVRLGTSVSSLVSSVLSIDAVLRVSRGLIAAKEMSRGVVRSPRLPIAAA